MPAAVRLLRRLTGPAGILLFALGLFLGMALFGVLVWAEFEVILFDPAWRGEARLRSLRCPAIITTSETGTVSARVSNPLNRPVERYLRVHMSAGSLLVTREFTEIVALDPGQARWVGWSVSPDDAVYDRLIMVNVVLRRRYPLPARQATCGILVVDVPYLTGRQLLGLWPTLSVLGMGGGYALWVRPGASLGDRERRAAGGMIMLAVSVLVGTFIAWLGWWLPGLILFFILLIAVGVIIGYYSRMA